MLRSLLRPILLFSLIANLCFGAGWEPEVVPLPAYAQREDGQFLVSAKTVIVAPGELGGEARYLQRKLQPATGLRVPVVISSEAGGSVPAIRLVEDRRVVANHPEGYVLEIESEGVVIRGGTAAGVFYGIQTMLQLLPAAIVDEAPAADVDEWVLPCGVIKDMPRFGWRAFMLDEARHFKGEAEVKKLLDQMAALKLNVFHWHLTDDQGWRIEIKKYPRLAEVGGRRADTQVGGWGSERRAGEPHAGYYTQEQIKRIVAYAAERHIKVVPEIGMPGHAAAAIAAYPELGTLKNEVPVMDNFDEAVDIYDPSSARVYEMLGDILDEVAALFPGVIIHIGGDEVHFTHWKKSDSIRDLMQREKLKSMADVQLYFTKRVAKMVEARGKVAMGWNEIYGKNLHGGARGGDDATAGKVDLKTIIHFWAGNPGLAKAVLADGYRIVNSWSQFTYLNQAYARTPLKKMYGFEPVPSGLSKDEEKRVLGMGCQMWGEWVPSVRELEYYIFPRIAAHAEVAWSAKERRDYAGFVKRLKPLVAKWQRQGIRVGADQIDPPEVGDFADAPVIGAWSTDNVRSDWGEIEWNVEYAGDTEEELHFALVYMDGKHALEIERADLLVDGKIVASDLHRGSAGGNPQQVVYSFMAPAIEGGQCALRVKVRGMGGTDSRGQVKMLVRAE
ncbi:beta-N-acetylhexosaminidase [Sulfuriroseicoccus oceanibius]|uniref:beta-N-acetylhexosaminidase n=1 Tax=Sulfuriroseicoccus oceanibius TaxID=2707525 RepID=A0A6B3L749_9BACT|nr:beta-N-acetylhexosaminidase [Sulfuriroseicoccus oceanibius]QQL45161.1 beta-N-acetylhexosaminidase [Sulfuriroseicoccus oceanibius]